MHKGTQSELVKELGCSRTAISKLVKTKDYRIIYIKKSKRIDIDASLKALIDSGFGKRSKPISKKPKAIIKTTEQSKDSSEADQELKDYASGKKQITLATPTSIIHRYKELQKAESDRIKNDEKLKTLVDFSETSDTVFNFLRPLRDDLLEVAKRVSPLVYMAGSKLEAEKFINQEIERIMLSRVGNGYKLDEDLKKKIIKALRK